MKKSTAITVEEHDGDEASNYEERKEQRQEACSSEEPVLCENTVPGSIVQTPRLVNQNCEGSSEKPQLSPVDRRVQQTA